MNEIKVSINELISIANYSVEESIVPPFSQLEEEFSDTWKDTYFDEDLKDKAGKHCFVINDNCNNSIRGIYVSEQFDNKTKINIIDNLDNVIFDLLYNDIVEQIEDTEIQEKLRYNLSYEDLLSYIERANISISDYEYSWLLILAKGKLDLLTLNSVDNTFLPTEEIKVGNTITRNGNTGKIDALFTYQDNSLLGCWVKFQNGSVKYYTLQEITGNLQNIK